MMICSIFGVPNALGSYGLPNARTISEQPLVRVESDNSVSIFVACIFTGAEGGPVGLEP